MKKILLFSLLLLYFSANAQETVSLKFIRPSRTRGFFGKIYLSIQGKEYALKNGGTVLVEVPVDYTKSLRIDCSIPIGARTAYYLNPNPGNSYEFEVGFKYNGIYIALISGEEARLGEFLQFPDSATVNNIGVKKTGDSLVAPKNVGLSEAIKHEWHLRGGKATYSSYSLTGSYFKVDKDNYGEVDGLGGGISTSQNWINLKMPEYSPGPLSWSSINYGWGNDLILYSFSYGYKDDVSDVKNDVSAVSLAISLNLGWTFGFGKYTDEGNWRGVALTLKYKPSLNLTYLYVEETINLEGSKRSSTYSDQYTQFDALGFGIDVDFSNFSATMNKLAPRPTPKLSFFIIPPTNDSPLFISLSFGFSFFSR